MSGLRKRPAWQRSWTLACGVLALTMGVANAAGVKIDPEKFRGYMTTSGRLKVLVYRTHPFNTQHPRVRRAVIVVHGLSRTADGYFRSVAESALVDHRGVGTAIFAPRFQVAEDKPKDDEHFWSPGWSQGHRSLDKKRLSSFQIVDELYQRLAKRGRFPNLQQIVLAGHSAGGQFVNRYAAGGKALGGDRFRLKFLVMNPSTFLYLDDQRPVTGKPGTFAAPQGVEKYNDYKYGLVHLNAYMKSRGAEALRKTMMSRAVFYLGGTADTGSKSLDQRPGAMTQGRNRFERWQNYRRYVARFPEWRKHAVFQPVPNIGHSGRQMFNSPAARIVLFR